MVRTLTRRYSMQSSRSFRITRMNERLHHYRHQNSISVGGHDHHHVDDVDNNNLLSRISSSKNAEEKSMEHHHVGDSWPGPGTPPLQRPQSEMDLMKERFAKLLLGEDMSGGGKGVSSALALSNAVTNLAASIFGQQVKLGPMPEETKARWRKEMDWLLSVTDHIVELVPSQQISKDGTSMEIMVTRQRGDLLANIPGLLKLDTMLIETLDTFGEEKEFWYVSKDDDQEGNSQRDDDKWWHPTVKVPANGLSETSRKRLQGHKESVNQVLKAAMAINAEVLSEIEIPESYIDSLPRNGRESLGDSIYKGITVEYFDPTQFLSTMDLSTEHKVLDLKNRVEASIIIWKRKMHQKDGKSSWPSGVSLEKRELFEERAETILLLLKQRFPGLPQSALDISKIQYNKDIGHAILESYSRILESLAHTVLSRIEDVLHADSLAQTAHADSITQTSSPERSEMSPSSSEEDAARVTPLDTPTLSDFIGWGIASRRKNSTDLEIYFKGDNEKKLMSKPRDSSTPKKPHQFVDKLESIGAVKSPHGRE